MKLFFISCALLHAKNTFAVIFAEVTFPHTVIREVQESKPNSTLRHDLINGCAGGGSQESAYVYVSADYAGADADA